jgi:hypothetical protein
VMLSSHEPWTMVPVHARSSLGPILNRLTTPPALSSQCQSVPSGTRSRIG